MFMLCIAQIGPFLVLVPAISWMYWSGDTGWATFLLVWSIPVLALDNFLRSMLIKRGADLPILLIFVGVVGGLIGFGLVGIFVGPVVLAVGYTLLDAWVAESRASGSGIARMRRCRGASYSRPEGRRPLGGVALQSERFLSKHKPPAKCLVSFGRSGRRVCLHCCIGGNEWVQALPLFDFQGPTLGFYLCPRRTRAPPSQIGESIRPLRL